MTELAARLAELTEAEAELRAVEEELAQARARFESAIRAAHDAGASFGLIAKMVSLSRERVRQLYKSR